MHALKRLSKLKALVDARSVYFASVVANVFKYHRLVGWIPVLRSG